MAVITILLAHFILTLALGYGLAWLLKKLLPQVGPNLIVAIYIAPFVSMFMAATVVFDGWKYTVATVLLFGSTIVMFLLIATGLYNLFVKEKHGP